MGSNVIHPDSDASDLDVMPDDQCSAEDALEAVVKIL
jgi:hypothetical protein